MSVRAASAVATAWACVSAPLCLAIAWLKSYPVAAPRVQKELLDTAIRFAPRDEVQAFVQQRVGTLRPDQVALRPIWMAALFLLIFRIASSLLQHSVMRIRPIYRRFGGLSDPITAKDGCLFLSGSWRLSSNGSRNDGHRPHLHMVVRGEMKIITMPQNLFESLFGPLGRIAVVRPPKHLIA